METNNILFRASANGLLMTEPKEKSNKQKYNEALEQYAKLKLDYENTANKETKTAQGKLAKLEQLAKDISYLNTVKEETLLSETTKTYLTEVFIYEKYGRKKDIVSKYLQKGLLVEEDSITLYSRIQKTFFKKNEEVIKNEFIKGTPDLYEGESLQTAEMIIDIKSSWDIFSFYKAKTEKEVDKKYYWQLQSYMALTGAKKAQLVYCLVDTPEVKIADEKRKFMWNAGILDENEITENTFQMIDLNCRYSDIPMEEKIHIIEIERNDSDIERLYQRIKDCRKFIETNFK